MNRIADLFQRKNHHVLNIYFTSGHPRLNDTPIIAAALAQSGVDLIELGMPYSDPLADGLTIQQSSMKALQNGMTLNLLFTQVKEFRKSYNTPLILMGYLNQVVQFGKEKFVNHCKESGIDGVILPDLPMDIYESDYKMLLEENNIAISFLITPQTSEDRIRRADNLSSGFIYMVSQSSITGKTREFSSVQQIYFDRINAMNLTSPRLIGFGIHDKQSYEFACDNAHGAIIGSAFIRALDETGSSEMNIKDFVKSIRST